MLLLVLRGLQQQRMVNGWFMAKSWQAKSFVQRSGFGMVQLTDGYVWIPARFTAA